MIEIKDLTMLYKSREVLKAINLSVQDGEIVGIIGPGGCGKSLLLKTLACLTMSFGGEILIDNRPIRSFTRRERARKICSIPNAPENMDISVRELIILARAPYKRLLNPFSDLDVQIAEECIAGFELSQFSDTPLSNLSRTHLKSTLLAYAFARNAEIIVLDDVTDSLDLRGLFLLQKMLFRYVIEGNKTAIIAGNDINFIAQTADRIAIMKEGSVKAFGGHEIIDPDIIKQHFGAEVFVSKNVFNGRPNVHFFPEG